jgi:hypothetical protein
MGFGAGSSWRCCRRKKRRNCRCCSPAELYRRKAEQTELEVVNGLIQEKRKVVKMCREILEETAKNETVKEPEKAREQEIVR